MKLKLLVITIITFVMCLTLPILAAADAISWLTEEYTAYVHGEEHDGDIRGGHFYSTGPPLPVTASSSYSSPAGPGFFAWDISSTITSSTINLDIERSGYADAVASAEFSGTYIADLSDPYFSFRFSIIDSALAYSTYWVSVDDITDGVNLFYEEPFNSVRDQVSILVPTIADHEISVYFKILSDVDQGMITQNFNTEMTYNMATVVVPEPISSTLFIIGGATLGFRRFRKK